MTMRWWVVLFLSIFAAYAGLVALVGFGGPVALGISFLRVCLVTAALVVYVPSLGEMFHEVPAPSRDYLLAGILLLLTSAFCFSVWNVAGLLFHVDTSIFTSPIAGFFSFLLVMGATFSLLAPYPSSTRKKVIAVVVGLVVATAFVFVSRLFL